MEQIKLIFTNIGLNSIVDIGLVYYVLYHGYLLIRDMRAKQLVKGIVLLVAFNTDINSIPTSYDQIYFGPYISSWRNCIGGCISA